MARGHSSKGYKVSRSTGLPLGNSPAAVQARNEILMQRGQLMPKAVVVEETEEQIRKRLAERFDTLGTMTAASAKGIVRAMIVSGPAGLGKSYDVEAKLRSVIGASGYKIVKGFVTPRGLYDILWNHKNKGDVLVFDDADAVFGDETSLNLLKAACDTTEKRTLMWAQDARKEEEEGIPNEFEFQGTIIYITNYDFDVMIARGSKSAPHFEALMSRAHYLDMALHTKKDYVVRIKQVCEKGMLAEHGLSDFQAAELVKFVEDNMDSMRELSLRMMVKLAGLYKMDRAKWQSIAKITLMR